MKKRIVLGILIAVVVAAVVGAVILLWSRRFRLSENYYGEGGLTEITVDEMQKLIDEKKSFAVFVYQPGCITSEDVEKNLASFSEKEQVILEKIKFSDVKKSGLIKGLRYYPSVALFHDGELVTFLRTDRNDDMPAYDSEEGFAKWWHRYVK